MKLASNRADQVLEPGFHRHVDVFVFAAEFETAVLDLGAHRVEARDDGSGFLVRKDAHGAEHPGVSLARANVLGVEAPVEGNGGVDLLHDRGRLRVETPAPHFVGATALRAA